MDLVGALFEVSFDAILVVDAETRVQRVSRAAAALFGDVGGLLLRELVRLDGGALPELGATVEGVALRGVESGGAVVPIRVRASRLADGGAVIICRDLSSQHRAATRLLEELKRQIGKELHDGLAQLLTGTSFMAKALEDHVAPEHREHVQRIVELINESIGRVRSLTRGLAPRPRQPTP